MKRRPPPTEPGVLPAELADGPFTAHWLAATGPRRHQAARAAWVDAGERWSVAHGLGARGWLDLLSADIRYWQQSLGRAHAWALDGEEGVRAR